MVKLHPLIFDPIFKERIWGGRNLETLYGKRLPPGLPIGESWEISDRPGDESVVACGPLRGRSLRWLMEQCPDALLGRRDPMPARFPLLVKIIDARETLSLQVHPPALAAARLGGQPKSEMWYVAKAGPRAELFAGLKKGVSRAEFERKLAAQSVAECIHRIAVKAGDAMFLPSGRVHALGAETVVFEIQQNSDTTFRVFDWNRIGLDGKARPLHVAQSLASIDFGDFEPALLPQSETAAQPGTVRPLVRSEFFEVSLRKLAAGDQVVLPEGRMTILGLVDGALLIQGSGQEVRLGPGQFCLAPAQCAGTVARAEGACAFLQIQ
jgi:mannose-6-phosphate isomerase